MKEAVEILIIVRFSIDLKMFHFNNGFTNLRTVGNCDFVRVNMLSTLKDFQSMNKYQMVCSPFIKDSMVSKFINTCVKL